MIRLLEERQACAFIDNELLVVFAGELINDGLRRDDLRFIVACDYLIRPHMNVRCLARFFAAALQPGGG